MLGYEEEELTTWLGQGDGKVVLIKLFKKVDSKHLKSYYVHSKKALFFFC